MSLTAPARGPQQPDWIDSPLLPPALADLRRGPGVVTWSETLALQERLALAAVGRALVLQLGDCAESLHRTDDSVTEQVRFLLKTSQALSRDSCLPVVPIGRMAGQFAKPRSNETEQVNGTELPVFRGQLANSEVPTAAARTADPRRLVWVRDVSGHTLSLMREHANGASPDVPTDVPWVSHEALSLDYEEGMLRAIPGAPGHLHLSSTHLPWIGERTRDPDGPHMRLLAGIEGPVACKVGPSARPEDVVRICARLDPAREPGRLSLILRLGRGGHTVVPALLDAVARAGHQVVWLSDPMHGNTVTERGVKTRHVDDVLQEAIDVTRTLQASGAHCGGLHLESTAEDVTECVGQGVTPDDLTSRRYRTLCDPRLSGEQTAFVVAQWAAETLPPLTS